MIFRQTSSFNETLSKLSPLLEEGNVALSEATPEKLRVMLIDDSDERNQSLDNMLQAIGCVVVACISTQDDFLKQINVHHPDVVVIDIENPNRDILENLRIVQNSVPKPMVMFSQDDDGKSIRRAVQAGVSAYVVDGIQQHRVGPILEAAIATFDQYQLLQKQLDVTRQALTRQKLLDRAKRILMKQRNLDEDAAYHFLRKTAMDRKLKLEEVAKQVSDAAELMGIDL